MHRAAVIGLSACIVLAGCAGASSVRTSQDTAIIQASAAPACGRQGAARVAEQQAAIETIRAGYDRYIITQGQSGSDIRTTQMPGTYQTSGMISRGMISTRTTYTPGPTIVSGSHNQDFVIQMFREGDPGAERALVAREILGENWERIARDGVRTCL